MVIALLLVSVGQAIAVAIPIADALIVGLGVMLPLGRSPFKGLPQIHAPGLSNPYANAFIYGLLVRSAGTALLRAAGGEHIRPLVHGE